jgi:trans-aconitate methyltransferase
VARFVGALPMVAAAGFYLFAAIPHLKREMWGTLHPYDAEMIDKSNGYEEHAATFMRARNARIGPNVVREWARQFRPAATVLELGCGHGVISQVLVDAWLTLYVMDSSPNLLHSFRERFPDVQTECAAAEESAFFHRSFDGLVAGGLIFLLPEETQRVVLTKAANALAPGGKFLFTAPREAVAWNDAITGLESRGLGVAAYEALLRGMGLRVGPGRMDEGENYYYLAERPLSQHDGRRV